MTLILWVKILFVFFNLGASVPVDSSTLTGDSAFAGDQQYAPDVHSKDPEILQGEPATEDSQDSPDAHSKDPDILLGEAGTKGSPDSSDVHSKDAEILQGEAVTDDSLESSDAHSKDPENLLGEAATEDSVDSPNVHSKDLENFANDSAPENLMIDMVNDVVHDVMNDVTSLSLLAPDKGDAVPPFPVTFPGCSCKWNEPGYSCESDILAPDSMAGQPCCCCGLKCLKDHRCSNDQCLTLGYDQQKEIEDEEKRIAELLNNSDVVLSGNIPAFTVDLGKGQCTNKKIIEKCAELGLTPVCDHSSYAPAAKVCWTNMQAYHWSHMTHRHQMKQKGFSIPEEFDQKSMGMCFMANYPSNQFALAPSASTHIWTNTGTTVIQPLTPSTHYKGPKTPSKNVRVSEMNDCSGELGCWRTLCVKKDPCSNCASCGNPCSPSCGKSNCPPPSPVGKCVNGKQMIKKYTAKWPHCTNLLLAPTSFSAASSACLSNPACNGFSYTHHAGTPATGSGYLKKNCDPERGGYGARSHDYWAKGPCQSQCASQPPSPNHLLVSGAWACKKTGAACRKVQMLRSNHDTAVRSSMENTAIGVTCCDAKGVGTRPGCAQTRTFDQAVSHCKSHGLDLCTAEQIKSGSGEATGCRFDHGLVWTCSVK